MLTVKLYSGTVDASEEAGWNPESMPVLSLVHGSLKLDWVTVWFPATNWNEITSPSLAVTLLGVKFKAPPWETMTVIFAAEAQAARPKSAEIAVKRMSRTSEGE